MKLSDLHTDIVLKLQRSLERMAASHKGFPFLTIVKGGGHDGVYRVLWSMDKYECYVVAEVVVRLGDCRDGTIHCDAKAVRKKLHLGEDQDRWGERNWYNQEWRFDSVHIPLDPRVIWLMLETTCDWDKAALAVAQSVLDG